MDKLSARELDIIDSRIDAFFTWIERICDGEGYDATVAREGMAIVKGDIQRLIDQARR
jgi:hypothetical protein